MIWLYLVYVKTRPVRARQDRLEPLVRSLSQAQIVILSNQKNSKISSVLVKAVRNSSWAMIVLIIISSQIELKQRFSKKNTVFGRFQKCLDKCQTLHKRPFFISGPSLYNANSQRYFKTPHVIIKSAAWACQKGRIKIWLDIIRTFVCITI